MEVTSAPSIPCPRLDDHDALQERLQEALTTMNAAEAKLPLKANDALLTEALSTANQKIALLMTELAAEKSNLVTKGTQLAAKYTQLQLAAEA